MSGVIYADVLVIINFFVTYFLLLSTSLLCRERLSRIRLLFSSLLGGFYSLSILLPAEHKAAGILLRVGAAVLPVVITFGYKSFSCFVRREISYLVCNFIFAGLMFGIWYFICPSGMYFNGSVVYFDIDLIELVVLTVLCYGFLKLFNMLFKSRAPVNTIFFCEFFFEGKEHKLKAFLDTGNSLTDPFTGKAVIVASREAFSGAFTEELTENAFQEHKLRFIPCSTLAGRSLLPSFSPGKVYIKGADKELVTDEVLIAITQQKILGGEYDAILPSGLFNNNFEGKDEGESEKITFAYKKNKD